MKPFLIGIAGPSCSGKSEVAYNILSRFKDGEAVIIHLDSYYHDLAQLEFEQRAEWNFDIPRALDHELLISNLSQLLQGKSIEKPIYLFPSHTRANKGETVKPAKYVIVEGLFALYWEDVRSLLDLKVYIDASDSICLTRRKDRDSEQRVRTIESVVEQYEKTVRPMFEKYVQPTKAFADLIINGENPIVQSGSETIQYLLEHYGTD